ncbi:S8 family peptidase [Thiomicrorhabdus sp.]|uniref:S8 family peptidase n=1 Tax=Thiomicrorhabdus sp. TaxID=2039724 RepID=UPI0029C6A6AE|nr:S8 family peptidase [Thiomicrorhabdus sp.]
MSKKNYLIGKAEELTSLTPPPKMNPPSENLYTVQESVQRLLPQFEEVSNQLQELTDDICPKDFTVTKLTLHPSYIAKGHFPKRFLREMGVHSIGSKSTEITPDRWTRKGEPEQSPTTSLFVAGKRQQLADFSKQLSSFSESTPGADDIHKIWSIESISPESKLKPGNLKDSSAFEVGIQLIQGGPADFIKNSFLQYAKTLGFDANPDISFEISNLWFVPVTGDQSKLSELAKHSFIRVVRPMPQLRGLPSISRSIQVGNRCELPKEPPISDDVRVAILDAGLPNSHSLEPWIRDFKQSDTSASDCTDGPIHGEGVTSAFLFGPIKPSQVIPRPFAYVDHHRILDNNIRHEDPFELYRTLGHIEDILLSRQYEFINISLGPDLPIEDDEIHAWTSLIDSYLADGETFLTIAAGNNGEADHQLQLNRIQVPSDCVNAIAVGSANTAQSSWNRASYSAIGPGRAPGRVKPDLLAFGGSHEEYFHVVNSNPIPQLMPVQGTSFSAPYLLRKAVGIRSLMGHSISPLAIKALLVNAAQTNGHDQKEVGWGKVPDDISHLIESPTGVARILYQGELLPGKYLRVPLPLPDTEITGNVKIRATCCFSTPVDPQDSSMYTKAGVEISWSNSGKKESFFQQVKKATEAELRRDAAKWESVLHAEKNKRGNKLDDPYFELHYMAREGGGAIDGSKASSIKYAFVVTIESPKHGDIFTDILSAYSGILTEIQPRVSIPNQVRI